MATGKFRIQGMKGEQDATQVDQTVRGVWGVQEVAMQPNKAEVTFTFDDKAVSYADIKQALVDRGYGVLPLDEQGQQEGRDQLGRYL